MKIISKGNMAEIYEYSEKLICKMFYLGYPMDYKDFLKMFVTDEGTVDKINGSEDGNELKKWSEDNKKVIA